VRKHCISSILCAALILTVAGVSSCGKGESASPAQEEQVHALAPEVLVARVLRQPIHKTYTAVGSVSPWEVSRISPKVSGRIKSIPVDEGDRVEKGGMLMLIDPFDYERALEHAQSQLSQAKASLERARRDLARMEGLYRATAVTEQNYQDAVTARDLALFQYDQAATARNIAAKNLEECRLEAPFSGIVTEVSVNEGELTGPQQLAFIMMDMSTVKVEVDLPEEIYSSIHEGNTSTVTVDAMAGLSFEGTITKIYPTIDPASRTFRVTIRLENPELKLRSGMTARAQVVQLVRRDALAVPGEALIRSEDGYFVYTVNDDIVHRNPVSLGIPGNALHEVLDGVSEGDLVVIRGLAGLRPGARVRIAKGEASPEK
jgi:RND family efflux transporter MFP subunit